MSISGIPAFGKGVISIPTFTPSDITSYFADFDADDLTVGHTIGVDVASWDNKEGTAGRDLVTVGGAPVVETGQFSGHNSVAFDGATDSLVSAALASSVALPYHAFVIARMRTTGFTTNDVILELASPGTAFLNNNSLTVARINNGTNLACLGSVAADTFFYYEALFNTASDSAITVNGTTTVGNAGTTNAMDIIALAALSNGTGNTAPCDITRAIIFNDEVTGTDLTNLRTWFVTNYGVTTPT